MLYNSNRQLNEKIAFYRDIENNFELNHEESNDIKRLMGACESIIPSAMFSTYENKLINNNYNKF